MNEFVYLSNYSNNRDISIQIIKSFYGLILTLTNKISLYYIFSNNFINQIISNNVEKYDDDFLSYYVNFLKSLTLKIDLTTIQFFFQKDKNKFPLLENALKLYNHSDPMIKNVVRNIFLTFAKLNYEPIFNYICSLPCLSYFCFISCRLRDMVITLNELGKFVEGTKEFDFSTLKSIHDDIIDEILYLQDIFSLGISKIDNILINTILYYFILPLLFNSVIKTKENIGKKTLISTSLAIYILSLLIKCIKNESFLNIIVDLIFNEKIGKDFIMKFIYSNPGSPINYFYEWKEQKKNIEIPFNLYITYNYSPKFISSLISNTSSNYREVKELVSKYESSFQGQGNFDPYSPETFKKILQDVVQNFEPSTFEIFTKYHREISTATGITVGLTPKNPYISVLSVLKNLNSEVNKIQNPLRQIILDVIPHNTNELCIMNVVVLLDLLLHKEEISKELLSNCNLLPCKDWFQKGQKIIGFEVNKDLMDIFGNSKSENDKESIDFIPKNDFDNIYYAQKYQINQITYDGKLIDSLINILLIEKPFCSMESLATLLDIETLLCSPNRKSSINQYQNESLKKIYYSYLSKIKLTLLTNQLISETSYEHFENQWKIYNENLHKNIDKMVLTASFFLNPNIGEYVEEYPFKKFKNEIDIFKHNIITFMALHDLFQKINCEEKPQFIFEKFPVENANFIFSVGEEISFNEEKLSEKEHFKCKIKKQTDANYNDYCIIIYLNYVFFIQSYQAEGKFKVINKYPLRRVEIFNERDDHRVLTIDVLDKGKYLDFSVMFESEEMKNNVKNLLETKRREVRLWEKAQIGQYFEGILKNYSIGNEQLNY